jgi:hypothetical protein
LECAAERSGDGALAHSARTARAFCGTAGNQSGVALAATALQIRDHALCRSKAGQEAKSKAKPLLFMQRQFIRAELDLKSQGLNRVYFRIEFTLELGIDHMLAASGGVLWIL